MEDFFSRFSQPMVSIHRDNVKSEKDPINDTIYVVLDYDAVSLHYYVRIEGDSRRTKPLHLRREDFTGAFSDFVGIYNELSDDGFKTVSWGAAPAKGVSLTDNPVMMRLLIGCEFLYDSDYNKISFAENEREAVYAILNLTGGEEKDKNCLGSLCVKDAENENLRIPVHLVTDSIAYDPVNHVIYEIKSVGPNFGNIKPFLTKFPGERDSDDAVAPFVLFQ